MDITVFILGMCGLLGIIYYTFVYLGWREYYSPGFYKWTFEFIGLIIGVIYVLIAYIYIEHMWFINLVFGFALNVLCDVIEYKIKESNSDYNIRYYNSPFYKRGMRYMQLFQIVLIGSTIVNILLGYLL